MMADIQRADGNQGNWELLLVKDKFGRPPDELGVMPGRSDLSVTYCNTFL